MAKAKKIITKNDQRSIVKNRNNKQFELDKINTDNQKKGDA